MKLFPAIDLKKGQCVRLLKGKMDKATIYNDDASKQALHFINLGCDYIHVVDLDGAFAGEPCNIDAVKKIIATIKNKAEVQLGGGIRDLKTITMWIDLGVSRIILGTAALKNPSLVVEACRLFPQRIVVGVDAVNDMVAVEGWAESSKITSYDLASKFEDAGVAAIVYTDINRDGTLEGANIESTIKFAEKISIPVIVSGGVASLEDIKKCQEQAQKMTKNKIEGIITGRAIYDGKLDIKEALKVLAGK